MDLVTVSEFIDSIGFPAAVCAALLWLNRDNSKQHREIMGDFKQAIENNTRALNELLKNLGD